MKLTFIEDICKSNKNCQNYKGLKKYIDTGSVVDNSIVDFEEYEYSNRPSRANVCVEIGDVLFAKMQNSIKVVEIDETNKDYIYSTGFYCFRDKRVISSYLKYYFLSKYFNEQKDKLCNGSTMKAVNDEGMSKLSINVPSINEQGDIVKSLDEITNTINKNKEELFKLDELVKSRFVEMFGDVETNDKNWVRKPLRELCDISRGGSPRPIVNFLGGTIPWIKISDATDGDSIYINSTKEHIIESGIKKSRFIKSGSLIFANCGVSLGFCRIINFDGCIHDGWLAFQNIDESLDKVFLLMTINQLTEYFRSIAPGGTQPNLNIEIMGNYMQIVPPMQLQKEFIDFVEKIYKSKFIIQKRINLYQELLNKKMSEYFD